MSSMRTQETMIPDVTEPDSDDSSCGEREARKRFRGEGDSAGPKKRRKQSTPVRFSSSLMSGTREESNEDEDEDDEDSEGKLSTRSSLPSHPTTKDENLNSEFRCQYCSRSFDTKEFLNLHLDSEHVGGSQSSERHGSRSPSITIKLEPSQTRLGQPESPMNILSVKNFANTWLVAGPHMQSQTQVQPQTEEPWSNPINQIATMSNHLQALSSFPGALAQYLPIPGFPLPDSGSIPRPPALGPTPVRIFNPDAYCDLCNKEFCNKYFLKTHKANKHGIYVDSPGPSGVEGNMVITNYATGFPSTTAPVKLEPPATPPAPSVPCDVCQKRFRNEESMKKHKQKMHNESNETSQADPQTSLMQSEEDRETPRGSPGGIEMLFKQEYAMEQEDTSCLPAPRHLSPQSIQQARDSGFNAERLRRLGVINPEAFCEICCKEYCNKYFLRTHKMKRHGIVIQDNERSPVNPAVAASWHQVQTSPLNLIVTESVGNSSESNDRTADDYECKTCGLHFQTAGLYEAHCRKMHESGEQNSPKQEYESEAHEQRTDSISEDLQKLQTMILQLNGLETIKTSVCTACGKDCESRTALRLHMTSEHGGLTSEDPSTSPREKSPNRTTTSALCTLCDKDYASQDALRKHITEEHQLAAANVMSVSSAPVASTTPATSTPPTQVQSEKKITSMTPTSSYCEICNKELCNKYFMKTHMQRMHGIEIENGAQIGGVICNICNKELCSKYFLRVHKHNTHGIVDENTPASTKQESYDVSSSEDSALKPEQLGDLSHRYFTHFTEVCPICSRRFRSVKWLKAHLLSDHGKAGIDKWRDMDQHYQSTARTGNRSGSSTKNTQPTSNLKIPNGFEVSQFAKSMDLANMGNQVFSNLFGAPADDSQLKTYRCSHCNFSTTVLPFLFLHERSHLSPPRDTQEADRPFQCAICTQVFHQPELLHQHLLAKHQFPTLLSQFQPSPIGIVKLDAEKAGENNERSDQEMKDDCVESGTQIGTSQNTIEAAKNPRQEETAVQVTSHGAYKCAQCGYATTNLNRIKKHVRKDHKTVADLSDGVLTEFSKTLRDVANKHKVPACYAMPQDDNPEKTLMQPFLIEEQDLMQPGEESGSEKRFVPALVYLPVKSRIGSALTASFTLSPA